LKRPQAIVYWKVMRKDVKYFAMRRKISQRCKYDTAASPGLLQPPEMIWQHITTNFIKHCLLLRVRI